MANDVRGKFVCGKSSSANNKSDNIKYLVTFLTVDYRWAECCVYNRRLMGASNGSVCVCVCVCVFFAYVESGLVPHLKSTHKKQGRRV